MIDPSFPAGFRAGPQMMIEAVLMTVFKERLRDPRPGLDQISAGPDQLHQIAFCISRSLEVR